jgi:MFS family permease
MAKLNDAALANDFAPALERREAAEAPYPRPSRAWALVAVFFFTSIVSVLDRGIITLTVDPIRHDLGISDLQISLLQGLSFGIFYAIVGLPLGLSADRVPRRTLLAWGVVAWSLATIYGGFAASFGHLFLSRLLVGLGEATLAPCAVSMISDMFPPQKRGRPISVYLMGQAVSGGVSIILTGLILKAAPRGGFAGWPVISHLAPWRVVFVLCGLSGFLAVLMLLAFREPQRRGVQVAAPGVGFGAFLRYLRAEWRVFLPFYLGFAVISMGSYGMGAWSAAFLIRAHHLPAPVVGRWLGLTTVIAGVLGALIGGHLIDALSRRGVRDGKFRILVLASWCALPAALSALAPSTTAALVMLGFGVASAPLIGATMISAVQEMTPNNMRGLAVSLFGFTNTLLGFTLGPLLIATATEHLFHDPAKVGFSMMVVMIPAEAIGCVLFICAHRALRSALRRGGALAEVMPAAAERSPAGGR